MSVKRNTQYKITSVCKEDILAAFEGRDELPEIKKRLMEMTSSEMERLASKLSDDYHNQLFWDSLRIIFEDGFMEE